MNNLNQLQIVILGSSKLKRAIINKTAPEGEKDKQYEIVEIQTWASNKENLLKLQLDLASTPKTLIISVRPDLNQFITERDNIHFFDSQKAIDYLQLDNIYAGFGEDRLAALLGGVSMSPNSAVAMVDLGTCNTFTIIRFNEDSQVYKLANSGIAPGITTSLLSLHEKTTSLPLLTKDDFLNYCDALCLISPSNPLDRSSQESNFDSFINPQVSRSTRDSICEGVLIQTIGFIEKVEKFLLQENTNKSQLIITGGWSETIGKVLQCHRDTNVGCLVKPNICFLGGIEYLKHCN